MEVVVNIDELTYKVLKYESKNGTLNCWEEMIANGIPLQKELGRWEEVWDKDHLTMCAYECSKCEVFSNTIPNYCPNCGMKMENGKEVKVIYRMPLPESEDKDDISIHGT